MKIILKMTGFIVAFVFLAWAYFNYPFQVCPVVAGDGEVIPCSYFNIHGYLNSKLYPLGSAVIALATLAAIIFVFTIIKKHRGRNNPGKINL